MENFTETAKSILLDTAHNGRVSLSKEAARLFATAYLETEGLRTALLAYADSARTISPALAAQVVRDYDMRKERAKNAL